MLDGSVEERAKVWRLTSSREAFSSIMVRGLAIDTTVDVGVKFAVVR
jgi:hypothetical protein